MGAVLAAGALAAVVVVLVRARDASPCAPGFDRTGARCLPRAACPSPLVSTPHGCDAGERDVVVVPATSFTIGPSDWEAEGRVAPRKIEVGAFAIDRLEVTAGRACESPLFAGAPFCDAKDPARAASAVPLESARAFCRARGGRLPTEDEWVAAAGPKRYPWGDTGAVCRRAAWGLEAGPCADGAVGPDTAGAHPDGVTALGIHDLAGNVAEWVEPACDPSAPTLCVAVVRGGSWRTALATELRTWLRREVATPASPDATIGFRCAYAYPEIRQ